MAFEKLSDLVYIDATHSELHRLPKLIATALLAQEEL